MIGMHPGMLVRAIERGREKKCLLEDKVRPFIGRYFPCAHHSFLCYQLFSMGTKSYPVLHPGIRCVLKAGFLVYVVDCIMYPLESEGTE